MRRLACVDLPAFALQILLKEHPDWRALPSVVVASEKSQALILWVNEKARNLGIRPGHRHAAALALSRDLRAGVVSEMLIAESVARLTEELRRFTPEVEPASEAWHSPGLFWLNASGLESLYPSLSQWGREIREALEGDGWFSSVSVGFSRFGSYAVARAYRGLNVFSSRGEEERAARSVDLSRLDIPPEAFEAFLKLGVRTVAEFVQLPARSLRKRWGAEIHDLHRLATGDLHAPLRPALPEASYQRAMELPGPEADSERLLFFIKQLLDSLLGELDGKSLALRELTLSFLLDDHSRCQEELRPDAPTLDAPRLLGLTRLRLETVMFPAGVVELSVSADAVRRTKEQLTLAALAPRRDPNARHRAFARLRAELGDDAVVQARLLEGHLPGARFQWVPIEALPRTRVNEPRKSASRPSPSPEGGGARGRRLIRRIYDKPIALPPRSRHEPDGWMLRGLEFGPVRDFLGPYILSGGWWKRTVQREYYFVKMQRGDVFWVFFDRSRRRWFLEGRVE